MDCVASPFLDFCYPVSYSSEGCKAYDGKVYPDSDIIAPQTPAVERSIEDAYENPLPEGT